ncbi:MAG: DUF962 domain-containing protein [Alphaproteobacteria bacterium]|nr:DUF962 domain-containing protein [Alphaproteobacteria bacterium]
MARPGQLREGRFFERQKALYAIYHTKRGNRFTHFFGIPAIVVSIMVVLASVSIGTIGGQTVS